MIKIVRITAMWCSGCLITKKAWLDIEKEYPSFEYITLDYDLDYDRVLEYNVLDILPVVIIFKDDVEVKRIIGEKNKKEIYKELEEIL